MRHEGSAGSWCVGVVTPLGACMHEAVTGGRKQQGCLSEFTPAVGLGSRFACAYRLPFNSVCVVPCCGCPPAGRHQQVRAGLFSCFVF